MTLRGVLYLFTTLLLMAFLCAAPVWAHNVSNRDAAFVKAAHCQAAGCGYAALWSKRFRLPSAVIAPSARGTYEMTRAIVNPS